MYIRWIVRGHKNEQIVNVTFHDAYLVEAYRDEKGDARQRTVAYLGNIRQIGGEFPNIERELFLLRAARTLESIPALSPLDCQDLLKQLHRKVQPLNTTELMYGFVDTLRWYYRRFDEIGNIPNDDEMLDMIKQARHSADPPLL